MIEVAPESDRVMSYNEALLYCQFLDYDGHQDWRMPTEDELSGDASNWGWYLGDVDAEFIANITVTPVRDVTE